MCIRDRSKEARIGYMEQHACADPSRTLWDEVESVFAPVAAMERELEMCIRDSLEAAHDHLFTKLLHGNVHVHITAEPAKGNLHYPFVLSGNIPLLKLAEEPPVVFKQQPDVADLIPGGGEPVQPDAEGEAGIDFRVDAAAPQHVGVCLLYTSSYNLLSISFLLHYIIPQK